MSFNFYALGAQYAKRLDVRTSQMPNIPVIVETAERLDGIVDLNLGLEYRYTKKVSAFINFNNIASTRYERWQDYPTQRFNVLGGLKVAF